MHTNTNPTRPITTWLNVGIFIVKRMPAFAVSFAGVFGTWSRASQRIFSTGNGFKMNRIDTDNISAQMVN